ncbi:hypothetical protein P153DRAFT_280213 [Dothidotthia symphoricarpi CBS 119687]|uniref:Uncharacterized protein n=1 Tax=Dothidotthia symphoricarpi CBS 119687 TaxID=1392245 RepID=A0A6A6ATF9_9PLEO|nr:uncharacterized protein P153DRAFT_280213 [Dothidotthia symphoricarpi CBS 119687]KAF2134254.1 hypothetical protein P153DRAFT_280213 [Dothidotthia symphoricarpi CBS 119687]
MSNAPNGNTPGSRPEADLAEAFKELSRGEQTAASMEQHLDSIEKKIEELLAQAEQAEKDMAASTANKPPQDKGKDSS